MPSAPEIDPTRVGLNETFTLHDLPAAIVPPQLSVSEKSLLVTKTTACADAPLFVIVTVLAALVAPTTVFASASFAGETVRFCAHAFRLAATNTVASNKLRRSRLATKAAETFPAKAVKHIGSFLHLTTRQATVLRAAIFRIII
jgi:hypothetical protein